MTEKQHPRNVEIVALQTVWKNGRRCDYKTYMTRKEKRKSLFRVIFERFKR